MESGSSRTFTADKVVIIFDEADKFEKSDDEFTPCGNFTDLNDAKTLFPSKLLAPSSMPFLTFTTENRYPASRDSLLNTDLDCIVEGTESLYGSTFVYLLSALEVLDSENELLSKDDYSDDNSTTDKL